MRILVCLETATDKLLEMQSPGDAATMIQNAVRAGYAAGAVHVVELTDAEWIARRATLSQPAGSNLDQFNQALIMALDGIDIAAKFRRAKSLRQQFPGFTEPFLRTIEGSESPGKAQWRKAFWADVAARVGTASQIITATERDAILALAASHGVMLR